jgi:hypothetical protein
MPSVAIPSPRGKRWGVQGIPRQQVEALRRAAEIGPPQDVPVRDHRLTLVLPPMGLAVVEIH